MKDLLPPWLRDPAAYAQSANLDMQTVLLVAGTNLVLGTLFVTVFEVLRRRSPWLYSPKASLLPGSTPGVMHGAKPGRPLAWVRPLLSLDEETLLRCAGYDAVVYLRMISLALRIFGSFAPYAFVVLLPVNASVLYLNPSDELVNNFNRLSIVSMPRHDSRVWAHCVGVVLLTLITMRYLYYEAHWYTQLRHRFLTDRDARQRTILVQEIPVELRGSNKLAEYFAKLYPGKVVGAVLCRRLATLTRLVAARETTLARLERVEGRRARAKMALLKRDVDTEQSTGCFDRYSHALEDIYDPCCWACVPSLSLRARAHEARLKALEQRVAEEIAGHAAAEKMVGRPAACRDVARYAATVLVDDAVLADTPLEDLEAATSTAYQTLPTSKEPDTRSSSVDDDEDYWSDGSTVDSEDSSSGLTRCRLCCSSTRPNGAESASLLGPRDRQKLVGDKAFVTFKAFTGCAVATQVFHAAGGMRAQMAPEPRDIIWSNVHVSSKQRRVRKVIADAIVALLLIFYIVPVTLISLVLSEQALTARWPALEKAASESLAAAAFVKMLQPMGLIGLMLLLPPFFLALGVWEGHISWSANTVSQLSRYYSFQITNVLLVTTVAGSLVKSLSKILDRPRRTFDLLGESLPQVCAFFACYIFIKAFAGLTLELSRGIAALHMLLKRLIYPFSTPRDKQAEIIGLRDFDNPGWFSYGKYGAQDLLVVVLLMTYSVMTPLILVPGLLFFAIAAVVYRHQFLYVYTPIFESGGLLWPRFYRRTLFSLFILQFTMTGLFFIKRTYLQAYCTLALSAATYVFKIHMRSRLMSSSVAHHLPMELATAVDDAMRHETKISNAQVARDDEETLRRGLAEYLQPPLHQPPRNAACDGGSFAFARERSNSFNGGPSLAASLRHHAPATA